MQASEWGGGGESQHIWDRQGARLSVGPTDDPRHTQREQRLRHGVPEASPQ